MSLIISKCCELVIKSSFCLFLNTSFLKIDYLYFSPKTKVNICRIKFQNPDLRHV